MFTVLINTDAGLVDSVGFSRINRLLGQRRAGRGVALYADASMEAACDVLAHSAEEAEMVAEHEFTRTCRAAGIRLDRAQLRRLSARER
jgi:hypothetical protein